MLPSRLRARDQDSRRTDLLSPDDPYAWVCGPPHMPKMAILKSVVHALDYITTLPRRILNGHLQHKRRAFDDPNIASHLATLADQADHLLLAHASLHSDLSLHSTSRPFAQKDSLPEFSDQFLTNVSIMNQACHQESQATARSGPSTKNVPMLAKTP